MKKNIAVLAGDGIGPEIIAEACKVLAKIEELYGHTFSLHHAQMGGCAIDATGEPLPRETLDTCLAADSVLLGAVGGPKWAGVDKDLRPETGLLGLRRAMGLYANLRPAVLYPQLKEACPLKEEIAQKGIDFVVVRELTGGIYFGKHETMQEQGDWVARDEMLYSAQEIRRIAHRAFALAQKRKGEVTSVDKANVLDTSLLWRKVVTQVAKEYPDVHLTHLLVDNAAMQLVKNPAQFDVIVTENMFGDILTDEASMITGSIGMIPSSSLGEGTKGLYEPIHGSAPDIAGQDLANPIGTILSVAMMLRDSFGLEQEACAVEQAVQLVLSEGYRTKDIMSQGCKEVPCSQMGNLICGRLPPDGYDSPI